LFGQSLNIPTVFRLSKNYFSRKQEFTTVYAKHITTHRGLRLTKWKWATLFIISLRLRKAINLHLKYSINSNIYHNIRFFVRRSKTLTIQSILKDINNNFSLSVTQLCDIASNFRSAMFDGLYNKKGPLKMLPSFLEKPTGEEKGDFLALDFGGTNIRILLISLKGNGKYNVLKECSFLLRDQCKKYDYTSSTVTGKELFEFITEQINDFVDTNEFYYLGHTFSFPCRQIGPNNAILLQWTKEINTSDVEGKDITLILEEALKKNHLGGVIPKVVINDTVGTLLTAAYQDSIYDIGSIAGTGHNTCYLESLHPDTSRPMLINIESGNFNVLPLTKFDKFLDQNSEKPMEQTLEKMVSGYYLGELFRIVIQHLIQAKQVFNEWESFLIPYSITSKDLSVILRDNSITLNGISEWLQSTCSISNSSTEERVLLRDISLLITKRAAKLIGATYVGVLKQIDPTCKRPHKIAIDGSLYEFTPGFAETIRDTLILLLGEKANLITVSHIKNGSGIGAAIAAATVESNTEAANPQSIPTSVG
jgi:hexokinase